MNNIKIPEIFKSSKGDGTLSRTIKGVIGVVVLVLASKTPLTEVELVNLVNELLLAVSTVYAAYGASMKVYNRATEDKK